MQLVIVGIVCIFALAIYEIVVLGSSYLAGWVLKIKKDFTRKEDPWVNAFFFIGISTGLIFFPVIIFELPIQFWIIHGFIMYVMFAWGNYKTHFPEQAV